MRVYTYITRTYIILYVCIYITRPTRRNQFRRACTSLFAAAVFFLRYFFFFHPLVKKSVSEYITRAALAHPRTRFTHTYYASCADRESVARPGTAAEISSPPSAAAAVGGIENRNNCASWRVAAAVGRVRGIFTNRKRA